MDPSLFVAVVLVAASVLALLVVAAKAGGLVAERFRQPAVLGELLVGIGVGNLWPTVLGGEGTVMVLVTTVVTPVGLRWAFTRSAGR